VNTSQAAGRYDMPFNASSLSSGIYFCSLSIDRRNIYGDAKNTCGQISISYLFAGNRDISKMLNFISKTYKSL